MYTIHKLAIGIYATPSPVRTYGAHARRSWTIRFDGVKGLLLHVVQKLIIPSGLIDIYTLHNVCVYIYILLIDHFAPSINQPEEINIMMDRVVRVRELVVNPN